MEKTYSLFASNGYRFGATVVRDSSSYEASVLTTYIIVCRHYPFYYNNTNNTKRSYNIYLVGVYIAVVHQYPS